MVTPGDGQPNSGHRMGKKGLESDPMLIHGVAARCLVLLLAAFPAPQTTSTSEAPAIAHVGVDRLAKGADLVVEATVTGSRPIVRVRLSYQVADRFGDVALTRSGTSTWTARLAASRFNGNFSYIIHASDETGSTGT